MQKEVFVLKCLELFDFQPYQIIKKKMGQSQQIVARELFEAIFTAETASGLAVYFNVSVNTITRMLKKTFPNLKPSGGSRTWRYLILDMLEYKMCICCEEILPKAQFYNSNADDNVCGVGSNCKECDNELRANHFRSRPDLRNAIKARRRAAKLQACPAWADLDKIKQIYVDCPLGHEVDHIVPLQGKEVCGLHVDYNLQYLTISDNRSKGNKLLPEYSC